MLISQSGGVRLADLIRHTALGRLSLLAGAPEDAPPVLGVRTADVPPALDRVAPDELLVVTDPGLLPTLVGRLDGLAPAAVVVRRHAPPAAGAGDAQDGAVGGPEEALARLCDHAAGSGLPVLEMPGDMPYDEVAGSVLGRLDDRRTGVLERVDALHTALNQVVLAGGDLDQIAAELAEVLGVGILVTSTDGRTRAGALAESTSEQLAGAGLVEPTGRFRVERVRARPAPLGDGEVRMTPIGSAGTDLARLVCVSPDRLLNGDDVQALERGAMVAALLITRQQSVAAVENKYRGDFLRDIFLERAGDPDFVLEHARGFGWDLDRPMVVLSAEVDPPAPGEGPIPVATSRSWQERFSAAWGQVSRSLDPTIPSVDFSSEVVTLVPAPLDEDGRVREDALRSTVDHLVAEVAGDRGGGRRPFSVGVSRVTPGRVGLPAAYDQARKATHVGRRITGGRSTTWFDELGLHRLIALVPDRAELHDFVTDVLGELAEDTPEAADLRRTLQVLLDTNLNVAEAARLQFFHYNTMRYRVTKLERLLGPFTVDPHLRLDLAVALQVMVMPH